MQNAITEPGLEGNTYRASFPTAAVCRQKALHAYDTGIRRPSPERNAIDNLFSDLNALFEKNIISHGCTDINNFHLFQKIQRFGIAAIALAKPKIIQSRFPEIAVAKRREIPHSAWPDNITMTETFN